MSSKNKLYLVYALLALFIFFGYNPIIGGDTGGYTQIVVNIANGNFAGYDFARTIGFPFFLFIINLIFGYDIGVYPSHAVSIAITCVQMIILLYSTYLLYQRLYRINISISVFYLIISVPFSIWARYILPEALTYSIFTLIIYQIMSSSRGIWFLCWLLVALKPNYFPVSLLILILYEKNIVAKIKWCIGILILCALTWLNTGYFSITTISGFARSQIVYNLFDKVPQEHKILGDIMSAQYNKEILSAGFARADIWTRCADQMRNNIDLMPFKKSSEEWKTGTVDLSKYIGDVSRELIVNHPFEVVVNISTAYKSVINFDFPKLPYQSVTDPRSIDALSVIKVSISEKIYSAFSAFSSVAIYSVFVILSIVLVINRLRQTKVFFPYAIFMINTLTVAIFGVNDSRYNLMCVPLLILALSNCLNFKKG